MATPSFLEISTKAHNRFSALPAYRDAVQLVPLTALDGGKRPVQGFLPNMHTVTKSSDGIALVAAVYPTANLGIRGRREVGAHLVLDIDKAGTIERIEREYGPLPLTYTTQTRPISKPYKRHVYLRQTEYSCAIFTKQVTNVTSITGYDLKCCGGWGHVVAEGSVRDGETITALHDVEIMPIPDSFVDWLAADIAKAHAAKKAQAVKPSRPTPVQTASLHPVVPVGDRWWVIRSRVGTFKNTGMSDDQVFAVLCDHIQRYFEDADALLSPVGIRKLRALIKKTPTLGATSYANLLTHRRGTRTPKPDATTPLSVMRQLFETCPPQISSADARRFFSVKTDADEQRLLREFSSHGYVSQGSQGSKDRVWIRPPAPDHVSLSNTHSFPKTETKHPSPTLIEHTRSHHSPHYKRVKVRLTNGCKSLSDKGLQKLASPSLFKNAVRGKNGVCAPRLVQQFEGGAAC